MATYSVAEAKNHLPKLLNRALAGEDVTITRRGKVIAKIIARAEPTPSADLPKSATDVEWLRRHIVTPKVKVDGPSLVRQMRDDSRY
jgi:prevent-host-death family protein